MALDESVYSNPLSFHPERFLAKPAGTGEPHLNQVFGFGRRFVPLRFDHVSRFDMIFDPEFVPGNMLLTTAFGSPSHLF
jgi:hypothetical protein